MDTVLGLSITSNAVGLVLVEGQLADGDIIDREAIDVPADGTATATRAAEQVAAAVLRTKEIQSGYDLHSIGLTWSDDAGTEASLLLESLAESGFDNVIPVGLPQASEAFALGIGDVLGYTRTAVCVVERDTAIVSVVDSHTSETHTSACPDVDRVELVRWLVDLMSQPSWQPEALVMVGSSVDLPAISTHLEEVLALPVFAPAEAELALARGAALASAQGQNFAFAELDDYTWDPPPTAAPRRPRALVFGMVTLAAGVVTFVASLAVVAGLQLTPDREVQATANRSAAENDVADTRPMTPSARPVADTPAVVAPLPAPPEALPVTDPQLVAPEAPPEYVPEAPPVEYQEPVYVPDEPVVAAPPPPPPVYVPPAVVPPVQPEREGFLSRIRDRLAGIGQPDPPAQVAPVPPPFP